MNTHRILARNAAVLGTLAIAGGLFFLGWLLGKRPVESPLSTTPGVTVVTATGGFQATAAALLTAYPYPPPIVQADPPHNPDLPPTRPVKFPTPVAMQVYVEPSGQFTLTLPASWKPGDEAGSFKGLDGYAKIGFLPEMGYLSSVLQVCEWLARQPEFAGNRPQLAGKHPLAPTCMLMPAANSTAGPGARTIIFKNYSPNPKQRYIYLQVDFDHYSYLAGNIEILYPTETALANPHPTTTLSTEEQAFWGSAALPSGVNLRETALENLSPAGPSEWSDRNAALAIQDARRSSQIDATATPTPQPEERLEEANAILSRFGFRLAASETTRGRFELFLDEKRVLTDITAFETPLSSDSGKDFGLQVEIYQQGDCLVRNHDLDCWNTLMNRQVVGGPFFIGERLFWAIWEPQTDRIDVWSDKLVVYSHPAVYTTQPPGNLFTRWKDDWLLEVDHSLIKSGEILNETFEYDEIFNWRVLGGKPAYFFRKGTRVGISFNGKLLPPTYDEVLHYGCCGYGLYNPGGGLDTLNFFARRGALWYFVELIVV